MNQQASNSYLLTGLNSFTMLSTKGSHLLSRLAQKGPLDRLM